MTAGLILVLGTLATLSGAAAAVHDQSEGLCESRFSELDWATVTGGGAVMTYSTSVDEGVATRFAASAAEVATLLTNDLGGSPAATLCLFGGDTELDPTAMVEAGLLPPGQRLHAAAFLEEGVLFIDTQQIRVVEDAIALGLARIALWSISGGEGYPEPLAEAVAQWYAARLSGSLAQHHSTMRIFSFFSDPSGAAAPTEWLAGSQDPVAVWNPEIQESPIGDFIESAVSAGGTGILIDPQADTWAAADVAWRAALRDELLQGADESRAWAGGVLIAVVVVLAAFGTAWWERRLSRRKQIPMGEIATVDGFFDKPSQ